jgi:hypothetical protein
LLYDYADALETDPRKLPDLKLAAMLASGQMHKEASLYGLLRLVGEKIVNQVEGRSRRLTTTNLQGVSQESMHEVGFFLAAGLKDKSSMAKFGLNPRTAPTTPLAHPSLPHFYCANISAKFLQTSVYRCLVLLDVLHSRDYCIAFDETVFKPGSWGMLDDGNILLISAKPHYNVMHRAVS